MADILALEKLFTDVSARFVAEDTGATNEFGWRVPAMQVIGARIAWVPGDPSGSAGETGAARNPGRNPRSLATFHELFHVIISAQDPSAPEDEALQYKRTRLLRDAWYRAVYLAARGTFSIKAERWVVDKMERRFGTALLVVCSIQSMVPDEALQGVPADTVAVIATSELDVTETKTISAADVP